MLSKIRLALPKIIPLVIIVILAFTYRDVLRNLIVIPLAYLIFFFRLISSSIGQQALWISFVAFAMIIAVISLTTRSEAPPKEIAFEQKYPTRLKIWIETVHRKERSAYFKWNLAQDLSKLVIDAIAYHQGVARQQTLRQIEAGQIALPPEILDYLLISQKPFTQTGLARNNPGNWWQRIWNTLTNRLTPQNQKSPLDIEPEKIIRYLENYLGLDPKIWEE